MNLENLNLKKGLIRLFIVSIGGAVLYGLFGSIYDPVDNLYERRIRLDKVVAQFDNPICEYVFNKNGKEFKSIQECNLLEEYKARILLYQKDNPKKYPEVSKLLIKETMYDVGADEEKYVWLDHISIAVFIVLTLWIISFPAFYCLRWIYKGFKSEKENLNFEKGLKRLFTISIVGACLYGSIGSIKEILEISFRTPKTIDQLVTQFNNPVCDFVFNKNSVDYLPPPPDPILFVTPRGNKDCYGLENESKLILNHQKRNLQKYPEVSDLLIRDAINSSNTWYKWTTWFWGIAFSVMFVLIFWYLSSQVFMILRWIYRGFKN